MTTTIHSEHFGRAFWLDDNNDVCSAPLINDGDVDIERMDYLADWVDMEGVSMFQLMDIISTLITEKTDRCYENHKIYAENITREQLKGIKGSLL